MARPAAKPRRPRVKAVKVRVIDRPTGRLPEDSPYKLLDRVIKHHRPELMLAKIALAWLLDVRPDKDGRLVLGWCRRAADLQRELRDFDFVIGLNATHWKEFDERQRLALLHHELCHAAKALDPKTDEQVKDERGRLCWRVRKHDLEEFREVVAAHGLYKQDLEDFARALAKTVDLPLFEQLKEPGGNGRAVISPDRPVPEPGKAGAGKGG